MFGNIKEINGKFYLSPGAASSVLGVSYKSLEKWVEKGLSKRGSKREKIEVELVRTPGGHRWYRAKSIIELAKELDFPISQSDVDCLEELCSRETE